MTNAATVVVTEATGFVGSHVLAAGGDVVAPISRSGSGHRRAALHNRLALEAAFEGYTAVIHWAASASYDRAEQERVTVAGTANVAAAARAVGVRRVILLSTAAVYGYGPFTYPVAGQLDVAPASERSAGRARAEEFLTGPHDVIVRPNLIYGRGDTSFIPALLRTAAQKPITGMTAAVSVVHVTHLAAALMSIATDTSTVPRQVHVNHPIPVRLSTLVRIMRDHHVTVTDLLARRAEVLGGTGWAFRSSQHGNNVNLVTDFVSRTSPQIPLVTRRMRATWLVHHLDAATPLKTLLRIAGLQSAEALDRVLLFAADAPEGGDDREPASR